MFYRLLDILFLFMSGLAIVAIMTTFVMFDLAFLSPASWPLALRAAGGIGSLVLATLVVGINADEPHGQAFSKKFFNTFSHNVSSVQKKLSVMFAPKPKEPEVDIDTVLAKWDELRKMAYDSKVKTAAKKSNVRNKKHSLQE
jgi:hypothetical protein